MFFFAGITFLLSRKLKFILSLSIASSFLAIFSAVLILVPTISDDDIVFYIVIFVLAFIYASLPGNKLVFSDAIYYDEYKSGSTQSHFPSRYLIISLNLINICSLYLLGVKLGFLLSYAIVFTAINDEDDPTQAGFSNSVIILSLLPS